MTLHKEFFDSLGQLNKYKDSFDMKEFFDTTKELEEMGKKINETKHEQSDKASILNQRALFMAKKLESRKEEIAKKTKTQKEYDAVYDCIDYLCEHFNNTK